MKKHDIHFGSKKTDLSAFDNTTFSKGRNVLFIYLWLVVSACFFESKLFPFIKPKIFFLRLFGADIQNSVIIKPNVKIKFPWKLSIGEYSWIGEGVWIDNLDSVVIGCNCCLSQGAMLLTGNHSFKKVSFDYMNAPIVLEDGCWVGAQAIVSPGVSIGSHAVLTVGSIATKDLEAYYIYQGNPANQIRKRIIT